MSVVCMPVKRSFVLLLARSPSGRWRRSSEEESFMVSGARCTPACSPVIVVKLHARGLLLDDDIDGAVCDENWIESSSNPMDT